MGYTTDFEGRFECRRIEDGIAAAFIQMIEQGDRGALAPLGDHLIERGDARGPEISALASDPASDLAGLRELLGLAPAHARYLRAFAESRRVRLNAEKAVAPRVVDPVREAVGLPVGVDGEYVVAGGAPVVDDNTPPASQPSLWCQWIPTLDCTAIEWDGGEKFYYYVEWLSYLIEHFLVPWGYVLNGTVTWKGEDEGDTGTIVVDNNQITTTSADPEW